MKTKMVKKLISIVCVAIMATPCVSGPIGGMSVWASLVVDWAQERQTAIGLIEYAHDVGNNGWLQNDCRDLALRIREFLNEPGCDAIFLEPGNDIFLQELDIAIEKLMSHNLEERQFGVGFAINTLHEVAEIFEQHIN